MKRILIIGGISLLVATLFFFVFSRISFFSSITSNKLPAEPSQLLTSPGVFSRTVDKPAESTFVIGTSEGGVAVKNFFPNIVDTEEELVILRDNDDYEIAYNTKTSTFYLYIRSNSLVVARAQAEKDLLDLLGINQVDACKLRVLESTFSKNNTSATKYQGLTFCPNAIE